MDVLAKYSAASTAWKLTQALPLVLWPRAVIGLLNVDTSYAAPGPTSSSGIEVYFARSLGLTLTAFGLVSFILSGALPLGSSTDATPDALAPYSSAVLLLTTLYHGATAFYCWACYSAVDSGHQTGFLIGSVVSAFLGAWGLWCSLFGGKASGHISRRTGADKRTSGFPFKNSEADRRKGR
ncbi:uncharacterized protein B0I36DRAFT_309128 [Microdochium trichocladiopsis]|uniref:Uncharacterized protein n=1 Tax=Microdochium trichocladiopsis TaxID=1682393 RepID=A0A9P9BUX8_9PEZI|nr:uncharacterized protein B0I36DRAFT_309128 [Microdochium trichocladiopsis]KAH7039703.1 hypothetical protein B0I36DRAFT_309128 [Microdochium trichocladiopsis]